MKDEHNEVQNIYEWNLAVLKSTEDKNVCRVFYLETKTTERDMSLTYRQY